MEIITDLRNCQFHMETAVAIGKFDGLHIGHRRLLQEILIIHLQTVKQFILKVLKIHRRSIICQQIHYSI